MTRWVAEGKLRAYSRAGDRKRYVDLDEIRKLQQLRPVDELLGDAEIAYRQSHVAGLVCISGTDAGAEFLECRFSRAGWGRPDP
jgi:hypothetical protein